MVPMPACQMAGRCRLSVLALSSRFDGPRRTFIAPAVQRALSVLALSSRFDGPKTTLKAEINTAACFQYSLCRVVLMVHATSSLHDRRMYPFSTRSVESF